MKKNLSKDVNLNVSDIHQIIDVIFEILNRYSIAYSGAIEHDRSGNENDVQNVVEAIRYYQEVKKRELEIIKEADEIVLESEKLAHNYLKQTH